jgi:polysaccharide chain length determinant protein (PEP-CTERM system associated)
MEQDVGQSIYYYLDLLRRRIAVWLAPLLLIAGAGTAAVISLPPSYRSEGTIVVESQQIPSSLVESTANAIANERIRLVEQRVMVRENLLRIVDKYGLFPGLRARSPPAVVADAMRASIEIAPAQIGSPAFRTSGPITAFVVGFEHESPEVAAGVANEFVTMILEEDNRTRTNKASNATRFVESEVEALEQQLAAVSGKLSAFVSENKDALPDILEFQLSQLESREGNLSELDESIRGLDDEMRLLDLELRMKATMGDEATGPGGEDAAARLDRLRAELVQKSSVYSDIHPEIRSLQQQIEQLEKEVESASSGLIATNDLDIATLPPNLRLIAERIDTLRRRRDFFVQRRESTLRSITELEGIIASAPDVAAELNTLEREKEAAQRNLDQMMERLATARLSERLEEANGAERLRLIEAPQVPQLAVGPDRPKLLVLVLGIAGAVGLASVYVADMFDKTIRGATDLRSAVEARLVVSIPYVSTLIERRRRRARVAWGVGSIAGVTVASMVVVHIFVMRLDVLLPRVLARIGLVS